MPPENDGEPRLRVVVPLLTLVQGKMGGSEEYARRLVEQLSCLAEIDLRVLARSHDEWASRPNVTPVRTLAGSAAVFRLGSVVGAQLSGRARHLLNGSNLVHFPLTVPAPSGGPARLLTIHDVQHHDLPHLFNRSERAYRRLAYDAPARRADGLITISNFSKSRIVEKLGVDAGRVHVIHLGHDLNPREANRGERENFLLYPARMWPHKNHKRLVEAVGILRNRHPDLKLVLTGEARLGRGSLPRWVEHRGLVGRPELLKLYSKARCLVFPSLYEGFGLPPLEAMASACPVAASRGGSIAEVCGEAVSYFDPLEPFDIARGIEYALTHSNELAARGLVRASKFSWERCAREHVSVYRHALHLSARAA